jgi:putative oxidoreductase
MRSSNVSTDVETYTDRTTSHDGSRWAAPLGRLCFSLIFLATAMTHFSPQAIEHAASAGVPYANYLVPLSGVLAVAGGLSILFGLKARFGAWLIVLFLVPVTVAMHAFWNMTDPGAYQMHFVHFLKNVALLGGAFLIAFFGAGPVSIDAWLEQRRLHGRIGHDSWFGGGHPSQA